MTRTMDFICAQFEHIWGQCIRLGSAEALTAALDENVVLLRDGAGQIYAGAAAVAAHLSEVVEQLAYLEPKSIILRGHMLDERWAVLYGAVALEGVAMQFTLCACRAGEGICIGHIHLSGSLHGTAARSEEEAAAYEMLRQVAQIRRQQLYESEAIYRFVLEATSDLICDIDLVTQQINFDRDKLMRLFEVSLPEHPDSLEVYEKILGAIVPADREIFVQKFYFADRTLERLHGVGKLEAEFRVHNAAKGELWLRIVMIPILREGSVTRLVANIMDIDQQKREELKMRWQSERDLLTNLLNRAYTETCINAYLQQGLADGALLMVDVDDFKLVNDNLGHQAGDRVLKELAQTLEAIFRKDDIVGRVGGDEFVVFIKGVSTRQMTAGKAAQITEAFRKSYTGLEGVFWISASVGIVMVSQRSERFEELWHKADQALYCQKRQGKNGWAFYADCPYEVLGELDG